MPKSTKPDPEMLRAFREAVRQWIEQQKARELARRVVAAELERIRQDVKREAG